MWITEDPWPPIILLGLIGAGLALVGFSSQRPKYLLFALLCGVACVGIWFIEQQVVTDGEKIEQLTHDLAEAFHQNEVEQTLSYFSPQNETLRAEVLAALTLVDIENDYRITDYSAKLSAEDTLAETVFRANATATVVGFGDAGYRPTRWRFNWRKEGDDWKIIDYQRLQVVGDGELGTLDKTE